MTVSRACTDEAHIAAHMLFKCCRDHILVDILKRCHKSPILLCSRLNLQGAGHKSNLFPKDSQILNGGKAITIAVHRFGWPLCLRLLILILKGLFLFDSFRLLVLSYLSLFQSCLAPCLALASQLPRAIRSRLVRMLAWFKPPLRWLLCKDLEQVLHSLLLSTIS